MDKKHWRDCPLSLKSGNIVQRTIFTREDTEGAGPEGAILRYIDRYARGFLEAGVSTAPQVNEGVQEVLFIASGSGKLVTSGQEQPFAAGDGILMPPGVEHAFINDGDIPVELYIISESVPDDADPKIRTPRIRNYRQSELMVSHWSYLVHPIFGVEDGLVKMRDVLVVLIDPMRTGDSHGHGPNMDEIWTMWKGQAVHVISQEVCVQTPGTAVSVCPSAPGHTLINHTTEPCYLFYFCSLDHNS